MSAVPFRLQPCSDASAAEADALTFGDPSLFNRLSTLNRVEILAENPQVRAGTIWYRIDQQYCFVEAVAIRQGMYPLVYKVLPEMMAAQLGFSFVGRYLSMTYGYATRSLVWDDRLIVENGARSYAWALPGMAPIVKLTAIINGSPRKPVLVRYDQDSAGAAADAALLNNPSLANRLADIARLEVVTGAEGTRAGTIWYYRNGNYCFVIASAFRPDAPADAVRLAPLLAAQLFGCYFVGNYSSIPADIKDKALCWDRETSIPIPELAPLSERLSGVQDFVVTFADVIPFNPTPDPDPYEEVCEDPNLHVGESGWSYDGCHWSYSDPNPNNCDDPNLHSGEAGWSYDGCHWSYSDPGPSCDDPNEMGKRGVEGYDYDGCHWSYSSSPASDYFWQFKDNNLGGSWVTHRGEAGWGWNGSWYYDNSPGSDYSWSANEMGLGGSWNYNPPPPPDYPPYGTVLDSQSGQNTVNAGCGDWVVAYWGSTTYADGNGGSYTNGGGYNVPSGTFLGNCNDYNYYSDGSGSGYYQGEYTGM